ncbi:aminotransferase class IV [Streptomyces sp. GbtcB6]|uniref:aminotransferase class IV n=1 Tax=Streptomyces sp. GbtcB6 TaxID=2824751 RepID=UPI001C308F67|nr:aminotransferase class IV [Streptomyces sp. GbtcB6]
MPNVEINGRRADVGDLHRVATQNYGHFTSMQVRDGAVRGLELHLGRLEGASRELFGVPGGDRDRDRLREFIRHAVRGERAASVRVTVVPGAQEPSAPDVMVSVTAPVADTPGPALRVRTVVYERELPHLKHLATMGLTYHRRRAREAGFDDALFVGRDGYVREGSIWNVAFWDGEQVVWPEAPVLPGITMQLLQGGAAKAGVPWSTRRLTTDDLPSLRAAAAAYSHCPAQPLAGIDDVPFPGDGAALTDALRAAWAEVPWDSI